MTLPNDLFSKLFDGQWLSDQAAAHGFDALLAHCDTLPNTVEIRLLRSALLKAAPRVADGDHLTNQLIGRLSLFLHYPAIAGLLDGLPAPETGWRLLNAGLTPAQPGLLRVLDGHTGPVVDVHELADGRFLSVAHKDYSRSGEYITLLWSPDGIMLRELPEPAVKNRMKQMPDGRFFSSNTDGELFQQHIDNPTIIPFVGHTGQVYKLIELVDGRLFTCAWENDTLPRLWYSDGTPSGVLIGHTDTVFGLLELRDGRLLTTSKDGTVRVWRANGDPIAVLHHPKAVREAKAPVHGMRRDWNSLSGVIETVGGKLVTWGGTTLAWWTPEGELLKVQEEHEYPLEYMKTLPNGCLVSWCGGSDICVWSPEGELRHRFTPPHTPVIEILPLSDNTLFVNPDRNSWVNYWLLSVVTMDGIGLGETYEQHENVAGMLELTDGRLLTWDGHRSNTTTLRLWTRNCKPLAVLDMHTKGIDGVRELADGRLLSWGFDGLICLWTPNVETMPLTTIRPFGAFLRPLSDGRLLSETILGNRWAQFWSADGVPLTAIECHVPIERLVLLKDGRFLGWTWDDDDAIYLWSGEGKSLAVMRGHHASIQDVLVLQDGRFLSWAMDNRPHERDNSLRLWSRYGAPLAILEGHTHPIKKVLQQDDGNLVSLSDTEVILWSSDGERLLVEPNDEPSPITIDPVTGKEKLDLVGYMVKQGFNVRDEKGEWQSLNKQKYKDEPWKINRIKLRSGRYIDNPRHTSRYSMTSQTLELWNADGTQQTLLAGHTKRVDGLFELRDGRILTWSSASRLRIDSEAAKQFELRIWSAEGMPLVAVSADDIRIIGMLELEDGRWLSWGSNRIHLWTSQGILCEQFTTDAYIPNLFLNAQGNFAYAVDDHGHVLVLAIPPA